MLADGSVEVVIQSGVGYTAGTPGSVTVNVADDDDPLKAPNGQPRRLDTGWLAPSYMQGAIGTANDLDAAQTAEVFAQARPTVTVTASPAPPSPFNCQYRRSQEQRSAAQRSLRYARRVWALV